MKINYKKTAKFLLPILIGAVLGYIYYFFIGCNSGTCPITSNPITTTGYGALMGLIWALPSQKEKKDRTNN